MLIAHTQSKITLSQKNIGESVNIEVDMLGKYVERAVKAGLEGSVLGSGLEALVEKTVERVIKEKGIWWTGNQAVPPPFGIQISN